MSSYTEIHKNADKILDYFLNNQWKKQRFSFEEIKGTNLITDLTKLNQALQQLSDDHYLTVDGQFKNYYTITSSGVNFGGEGGYKGKIDTDNQQLIEQNRNNNLATKKLEVDLANAERVYKTYFSTRLMAIISVIVSVALLIIKLAETFGWLGRTK